MPHRHLLQMIRCHSDTCHSGTDELSTDSINNIMSTTRKTTVNTIILNDNKLVEYTEPMFEPTESEAVAPFPEKFDPAEAVRMAARACGWLD